MLLIVLPTEVQIEIAGHLTVTSERPIDDLHSLWTICSSMHRINYFTLLARLTQVGNLKACLLTGIQTVFTENHSPWPCLDYLTRATNGGHNVAAYLVTIFIYRHNGGAGYDNTVRWYTRWIEGEEESWAAMMNDGGGPTSRRLSNKGCCCAVRWPRT